MMYFGENSMGCWEECILCCCRMEYSVDICLVHWSTVSFNSKVFCWFFLPVWPIYWWQRSITVLGSICVFKFSSVSLMKLGAPTLGTCKLTIVISTYAFISMKWPSWSLLINLGLKSTLSDISISTPACFGGPLAWQISFHPSQCLWL
jgi:hypothetical protein